MSGAIIAPGNGSISLTAIPISPSGNVIARNLYRTVSNGSFLFFLATVPDNLKTSYLDIKPDSALGSAPPTVNTASSVEIIRGTLQLANPLVSAGILLPTTGGTPTALTFYSESAGTFTWTIARNDTTTYTISRIGNVVTLGWRGSVDAPAPASGIIISLNAIPVPFRPAAQQIGTIQVINNGSNVLGQFTVNPNGVVAIVAAPAGGTPFISGQNNHFLQGSFTYTVL
jgi:hypothetical protein